MPYAELTEDGDRVAVETTYAEREAMKTLAGARWSRRDQRWTLPLEWGPIVAFRGLFGEHAEAGPRLTDWVTREYELRIRPVYDLHGCSGEEDQFANAVEGLYPLQRVGVEYLLTCGSGVLADDMGTGKTVQASVAIRRLLERGGHDVLPALVVCPSPVRTGWERELAKWAPDLRVAVARGGAAKRRKAIAQVRDGEADVLVLNWENLAAHSRCVAYGGTKLKRCEECGEPEDTAVSARSCEAHEKELNEVDWALVVADEAHRAANPKAKMTRALLWLGERARRRWALTGTAVKDHVDSSFGILRFVSPGEWSSRVKLKDRYCLLAYNPWSGGQSVVGLKPDMRAELFSILDPRLMRRTKREAMPWLPPVVRDRRYVQLKPKHRKVYDAFANDMLADLEGGQLVAWNPLVHGLRLTQMACAFPEVDEDGKVTLKRPSPKVDEMLRILDEMGDRPLVVFCPSLQVIRLAKEALDDRGVQWGAVDGDTAEVDRDRYIDAFQDGRLRVMLLTAAGSEGITLTRADTLVVLQRPWSKIVSDQIEGRVDRAGAERHDSVHIIDVVAENTHDEAILDALERKDEGVEEVLRDQRRVAEMLRRKELK